jgi:hypothetical protein
MTSDNLQQDKKTEQKRESYVKPGIEDEELLATYTLVCNPEAICGGNPVAS